MAYLPSGARTHMALERIRAGTELIDLLDRVLDKGIFVEASSRLGLSSATLSPGKSRIVVASNDSYHDRRRELAALNRRTGKVHRLR